MIADRDRLASTTERSVALACVEAGIEAAHPRTVIGNAVSVDGDALRVAETTYDLADVDEVVVLGGGKAAGEVAAAIEATLGDRLTGGVVVTIGAACTNRIDAIEGTHPLPTARNVEGTRSVLDRARAADASTLVLAVITGGGSALLAQSTEGVDLDDLRSVTDSLLAAGARIDEINAVRSHLSTIKGGGLARSAAPAWVVGLLLSDVVGDDPAVIASGPTAPDTSTYTDAIAVLDRYGIDVPGVRAHLEQGVAGNRPETAGPDHQAFERVENHVLARGFTALDAARATAAERGYETIILSSRIRGEAREAAKTHVAVGEECRVTGNPVATPAVVLAGGETTVTVRGDGVGGPNLEFAASAGLELDVGTVAAVDTDGRDGGTDAAGGIVDAETVSNPAAARKALRSNDAYTYLDDRGALIRTGDTGTNVNDLRVMVTRD